MSELVEAAQVLADQVLFPAALEVDRSGTIPEGHWQRLAAAGFFGLAAPPSAGGPDVEFPELIEIVETLAGGCLATAFTWLQHNGPVRGLAESANEALRDDLLAEMMDGRRRCGVSIAAVIPDPPLVQAERTDGGWQLSGYAPFVSGWGIIDLLQVSGGDVETGDIISGLVPAVTGSGIADVEQHHLVAADATRTVGLRFEALELPDDRVVSRVPRADHLAAQIFPLRLNGSFALGVARRCVRLLDEVGCGTQAQQIRADVDLVRSRLDAGLADRDALIQARADGSQLALRAAAALVAAEGGRALLQTDHGQRLAREAVFTLVASTRDDLKATLLDRYASNEDVTGVR